MTRNIALAVSPVDPSSDYAITNEMVEPPPSTKRFAAGDLACALAAMKIDDEPTINLPVPPIPPGTPSPLGDDVVDETLTLGDLGIDHDDDFPVLPHPPASGKRRKPIAMEVDPKRLVIAIWTVAITMAATLTYVVAKDESSRAHGLPDTPSEVQAHAR